MRRHVQFLILSLIGVLVLGFSMPGGASDASGGISRRTFLKGLGAVAASPVMPTVPLLPPPMLTEILSEPLPGLVTEEFAASIAGSVRHSLGSWAASTREMHRQIREFLENDEVEQIRMDPRGEDIYEWAYAHQMVSRHYPSMEEMDAGSEAYTQGLIRIVTEISRDRRFSAEFLRSEAVLQIKILEGQFTGIFQEKDRIDSKQQNPLVHEFRQLFMQQLKKEYPDAYHGFLRNWGLTRSLKPTDHRILMNNVVQRLGFSEVDLARYTKHLNPLESDSQQENNLVRQETSSPKSIETQEPGDFIADEELGANTELQFARSRILTLIQSRTQQSCNQLLVSVETRESESGN